MLFCLCHTHPSCSACSVALSSNDNVSGSQAATRCTSVFEIVLCLLLQEFDLDQDIEQQSCGLPDCSMGVTTGQELIESGGLVPVRSSQALMNTA